MAPGAGRDLLLPDAHAELREPEEAGDAQAVREGTHASHAACVRIVLALVAVAWAPAGVLAQQAGGRRAGDDAGAGEGDRAPRACARRRIPPTLTPSGSVTSTIRPGPQAAPCTAGGYGPYRVGRGPNHVTKSGGTVGDNGVWDFDRFQSRSRPARRADSLQGWWPVARCFQSGATTFPDYRRAHVRARPRQPGELRHQPGSAQADLRCDGSLAPGPRQRRASRPPTRLPDTNVQPVKWSPTEVGGAGSTASAWMGMRSARRPVARST